MSSQAGVIVAMDWGGSWARTSVVNHAGELMWTTRVPTPQGTGSENMLRVGEEALLEAISWCQSTPILGIGIAVAGPIDVESGIFYTPPNLLELNGISLIEAWQDRLIYPIHIGNDATLAALAEYHLGAGLCQRKVGRDVKTLLYLTISTGVGGGVIDRGNILLGAHGMAAEIGHIKIDTSSSADLCNCGGRGCLEALVSGTAIARKTVNALSNRSETTILNDIDITRLSSQDVFTAYSAGDSLSERIINEVISDLAHGISDLIHSFNPDLVVLGGGVTVGLSTTNLLGNLKSQISDSLMSERHKDFEIMYAQLGDSSGMIGASLMVQSYLQDM